MKVHTTVCLLHRGTRRCKVVKFTR